MPIKIVKKRLRFLLLLVVFLLPYQAQAQIKIKVVTSFNVLTDITQRIAGNLAEVESIVASNQNAAMYSPLLDDVKKLIGADVAILNGLGLDDWMPSMMRAAGFSGVRTVASEGVYTLKAVHSGQDGLDVQSLDPHAWQDIQNGRAYVRNIARALQKADPENSNAYRKRANRYLRKLDALQHELSERIKRISVSERRLLSDHKAMVYLASVYNLTVVSPAELGSNLALSVAQIRRITRNLEDANLKAAFSSSLISDVALQQITEAMGLSVDGTLYTQSLSIGGPASTYVRALRHNLHSIADAIEK